MNNKNSLLKINSSSLKKSIKTKSISIPIVKSSVKIKIKKEKIKRKIIQFNEQFKDIFTELILIHFNKIRNK